MVGYAFDVSESLSSRATASVSLISTYWVRSLISGDLFLTILSNAATNRVGSRNDTIWVSVFDMVLLLLIREKSNLYLCVDTLDNLVRRIIKGLVKIGVVLAI